MKLLTTDFKQLIMELESGEQFYLLVPTSSPLSGGFHYKTMTKRKMTWQYIAGFFDGEGTIFFTNPNLPMYKSRYIMVNIVQAERQDKVIYKIKKFLEKHRIKTSLYKDTSSLKIGNLPKLVLRISSIGEVPFFLKKLYPYLIVKRKKAEEAIEFCSQRKKGRFSYGNIFCHITLREEDRIKKLLKEGYSPKVISKKLKRSDMTIYAFLRRNHLGKNGLKK